MYVHEHFGGVLIDFEINNNNDFRTDPDLDLTIRGSKYDHLLQFWKF